MYEFIDDDRFEVQEKYWDFLETGGVSAAKAIKVLKEMINQDPDFSDPYITLAEYHHAQNKPVQAFEVTKKGYNRAMKQLIKKGRFPDILEWGFIENRHIIRMLFNYAMMMWETGEKDEALRIFSQLLAANPNDNIGARYAIVALLEGIASMGAYEKKFATKDGYLDAGKVEKWFEKAVKKYPEEIGWWFELE